jgi:enediyne biosynthesis protein E2
MMSSVLGSIRRLALAPSLAEVSFAKRGFPVTPSAATERLEAIPRSVVVGFEWAIDSPNQQDLERRLDMVEPELRGFAYEGAAMANTVLDIMPGRSNRNKELLMGPGQPHLLLAYIGIGFAMNHLPRPAWKKVIPDLSGSPFYPTMTWLAVDGYGFDLAYFQTRRWVDEQRIPAAYPWDGAPDYFLRAVDQGIGRALWFINGADVDNVTAAVARFATERHNDLWAGVGLAATFAGGASGDDLKKMREAAGDHHADLAVGSVWAVTGRIAAGFTPEHSEIAADVFTGGTAMDAVMIAGTNAVDPVGTGPVPPYEVWRNKIRTHFASTRLAHQK